MTQEEMKKKYWSLYEYMATSNKPENMKTFGRVMTKMMEWAIQNKPNEAQEWIDELECIKWRNYLTPAEAQKIVDGMVPKAPWSRDAWKNAMTQFELPMEEEPYFNACALWVEMNKMYSDFGEEIANMLGKPLSPTDKDIILATYKMALKTLKDQDKIYSIRKYFDV